MMKCFFTCLLLSVATAVVAQPTVNIIPQPVSLTQQPGTFSLSRNMDIVVVEKSLQPGAQYLANAIMKFYGLGANVVTATKRNSYIYITLRKGTFPPEGYLLDVKENRVVITGNDAAGAFRGIQSFLQLVPNERTSLYKVPCVQVEDYPRFQYRGMHLDVARHFSTVDFVKQYIDYLALYKFNTFHWHLTDDQGWRIEIRKYPKLTEVGGCRNGTIIGRYPGTGNDGQRYCGYYTQAQVKEIVAYAKDRHITVIPEIEMPGHASAALTAYPELGCTGGPYKVQETWGVFEEVFCGGKDKTFKFLQDVLDEVIQLFPSKYIHVGGDECPKESWKKCPDCQQRIRKEGLKDEHELQSYFIQRMEKYLNAKGRNIIGWDEILEGGLAPNATVMSWRGEEGGIQAAKQKHNVIMTPGSHCYFDYSQSRNEDSVTIGGFIPLQKVYSYEPVPAELTAEQGKYILGAQANLWTEYIKNPSKVQYMIFPRMIALAEVLWTPKEKKSWEGFEPRLQDHFGRLKARGINFSKAYFDPVVQVKKAATPGVVRVTVKPVKKDGLIRHRYTNVLIKEIEGGIRSEALLLNQDGEATLDVNNTGEHVFNWLTGKDSSRPTTLNFEFNKATARDIKVTTAPSKRYPGEDGINGLVNGLKSQKGVASPEWLGWEGGDLEAIIDLGSVQTITRGVGIHTLDQNGSWIYLPSFAEVWLSTDGTSYTHAATGDGFVNDALMMMWLPVRIDNAKARYVKVLVKNYGDIPSGKPGAGHKAWLFVDEIMIN